MQIEQTIDKMVQMKMHKMANSLKERLARIDHKELSHSEFIGFIVDDEFLDRQNKRLASRLRLAKFKESEATAEAIDYRFRRELNKQQIMELMQNGWIKKNQNIALTGPAGVGKSYLAQALGNKSCRDGNNVMFIRATKLYQNLHVGRHDGTYVGQIKKIAKVKLLIIDDFATAKIDDLVKQDLFEIIEDRYGQGSTIITSQLPAENWHEYLGGGILGDGICDRLLHNCHRIKLNGESYRKFASSLTETDHCEKKC